MYCKNCGNLLNDGDKFCPNCGTKVVSTDDNSEKNAFVPPFRKEQNENAVNEVDKDAHKRNFQFEEFDWNLDGYPKDNSEKKTEDIDFDWESILKKKNGMSVPEPPAEEVPVMETVQPRDKLSDTIKVEDHEDLGKTARIDKFYTRNEKNAEYQELIDKKMNQALFGDVEDQKTNISTEAFHASETENHGISKPSTRDFIEDTSAYKADSKEADDISNRIVYGEQHEQAGRSQQQGDGKFDYGTGMIKRPEDNTKQHDADGFVPLFGGDFAGDVNQFVSNEESVPNAKDAGGFMQHEARNASFDDNMSVAEPLTQDQDVQSSQSSYAPKKEPIYAANQKASDISTQLAQNNYAPNMEQRPSESPYAPKKESMHAMDQQASDVAMQSEQNNHASNMVQQPSESPYAPKMEPGTASNQYAYDVNQSTVQNPYAPNIQQDMHDAAAGIPREEDSASHEKVTSGLPDTDDYNKASSPFLTRSFSKSKYEVNLGGAEELNTESIVTGDVDKTPEYTSSGVVNDGASVPVSASKAVTMQNTDGSEPEAYAPQIQQSQQDALSQNASDSNEVVTEKKEQPQNTESEFRQQPEKKAVSQEKPKSNGTIIAKDVSGESADSGKLKYQDVVAHDTEEKQAEKRKKHRFLKFLLVILTILICLEIAIICIKQFAPESAAGLKVQEIYDSLFGYISCRLC